MLLIILYYALNILNIVQTNITSSVRVDTPYFDEAAFREAWYNAVCHNLWVEQTPPAIYGFADRVEIISHGLLKRGTSFIQCILPYNILDQAKADAMNGNTEQEVPDKVPVKVPDKVLDKVTVAQQKVLDIIIQTPAVTQQEISERLGISFRMVTKHIKALKDKGIIHRVGSRKTGYWEVNEEK